MGCRAIEKSKNVNKTFGVFTFLSLSGTVRKEVKLWLPLCVFFFAQLTANTQRYTIVIDAEEVKFDGQSYSQLYIKKIA